MGNRLGYGSLVISLDFEMMWGGLDVWDVDGYGRSNVANVRDVVDGMVALFERYGVHATFATVGFIMLDNSDEIRSHKPAVEPTYNNKNLSPYGKVLALAQQHKNLYFAPDVVSLLKSKPFIEIGTHTFCHYYCWEEGQTLDQFEADLRTACTVAREKGINLESIVFPRNQVSREYLDVCAKNGLLVYRGNARKYFGQTDSCLKRVYYRIARFLDSYINWGGNTTVSYSSINCGDCPVNVPASRMLRPWVKVLSLLEPVRLRRIKREMRRAAKRHELYHLWWHPHNFGANTNRNLAFLDEVLQYYNVCHQKYGMQSLTMKELYNQLVKKN